MDVSGQLHSLATLPPGTSVDRRLDRPQSWSGYSGEENNSQPLLGLELPIIQIVP